MGKCQSKMGAVEDHDKISGEKTNEDSEDVLYKAKIFISWIITDRL